MRFGSLFGVIDKGSVMGQIVELSADAFSNFIREGDAIVLFSASWCRPCDEMKPVFQALADELSVQTVFGVIDSAVSPTVAVTMGVRSVPSIALFRDGRLRLLLSGPRTFAATREAILDALQACS